MINLVTIAFWYPKRGDDCAVCSIEQLAYLLISASYDGVDPNQRHLIFFGARNPQ
jgi:hypothetical protein